jgi:uncharacterized membrane protein YeaQ/YmgE (transglycosylase-associated protein family)
MPPWLVLALLLALIIALIYQLASRRYGWRLVLYWAVVAAGMLVAEALAESMGWNVTRFGDLRLLPDFMGAAVILAVFWFLGV